MGTGLLARPIRAIAELTSQRVVERLAPLLEKPEPVQEPTPTPEPVELSARDFLALFDAAPPMNVDASVTDDQRKQLWANIASVWSSFGETDPYWSVLTDDRWRSANMSDADRLGEFYATGAGGLAKILRYLARGGIELSNSATCVEYGCGVGRLTTHLAARFKHVIAFDVSAPHIEAARKWTRDRGLYNIDFVLVRSPDDLSKMQGADFFLSEIVLQHNPPPIMHDVLRAAFSHAKQGAAIYIQVPTYSRVYSFRTESYLSNLSPMMEMHVLPQQDLLSLARSHHVFPLEITSDPSIGISSDWVSSVFVMQKD